jgi:hypothetical protein
MGIILPIRPPPLQKKMHVTEISITVGSLKAVQWIVLIPVFVLHEGIRKFSVKGDFR